MTPLSPESIHALQMALQNETDTIHIYRHMLQRVKNEKTLAMLHKLIEEENSHEARIREKILEGGGELPAPDNDLEIPDRDSVFNLNLGALSIMELINLAIENEKISRDFYHAQYNRMKNPEIKAIFSWLVSEEQKHIRNLQLEYDAHQYYDEVQFPERDKETDNGS